MEIVKRTLCMILTAALLACFPSAEAAEPESREDYQLRIPTEENLSENERRLDDMLTRMKQEADQLYPSTVPYAIIDWEGSPVHEELYRFCRELPKGGDLHVHDDKVIPVSRFIRILKDSGKVFIVPEEGPTYGYLYVASNAPDNAVPLNEALSSGLLSESELREILVSSDLDVPNGRWASFERLFSVVMGLQADEALLQSLYEEGFRYTCENNVDLLELRLILFGDEESVGNRIRLVRDAYYHVKDEYPNFTVRVIGTSGKNRFFEKEFAQQILRSVIHLSRDIKDEYDPANPKDFIIGIDLVNEEDASKPLSEYADFFLSDEVRESGLQTFLHAGESLRMENDNVIDAYLFGASRVGHGFNLYRFPELLQKFREKGIALEICPISNYRLGYVSDMRLHPGLIYLQQDLPVVICSDDGLFLTNAPLTDDYYAVILSWDLGIAEIKELCRNAILYGGLPEDETQALLAQWQTEWNAFVDSFAGAG